VPDFVFPPQWHRLSSARCGSRSPQQNETSLMAPRIANAVITHSGLTGQRLELVCEIARTHIPSAAGLARYRQASIASVLSGRRLRSTRTSSVGLERARSVRSSRPRERRDGSRRHSTRGGTDDDAGGSDSDSDGPGGEERLCECGCGLSLGDKRTDARYAKAKCRKRAQRQRGGEQVDAPAQRCASCGACLSRYGKGGAQCWACAFGTPGDRPLHDGKPAWLVEAIARADDDLARRRSGRKDRYRPKFVLLPFDEFLRKPAPSQKISDGVPGEMAA
jgi:hypothetical protein